MPPHTRYILRATHAMHAAVAIAHGGAARGWLSAATRAALAEVGGVEYRIMRLGAINGPELEGPRLPRGPPDEAMSVRPDVPVPEQLTVTVHILYRRTRYQKPAFVSVRGSFFLIVFFGQD